MGKLSTVRRQVIAATDPEREDLKEAIRDLDPTHMFGICPTTTTSRINRMHPRWIDAAYAESVIKKLTAQS